MTKIAVAGATGRVGRHIVDVLHGGGHDVVAISRSNGVDVITGDGLAAALEGVETVIDVTTGPRWPGLSRPGSCARPSSMSWWRC